MRSRQIDGLCPELRAALDRYGSLLRSAGSDIWPGVYLVGSAALDDWRASRSDLDIVTVTEGPLADRDIDALAVLHAAEGRRPYLDAVYVPRDGLGRDAADAAGLPHVIDGEFRRDGYHPDPVLWAALERHGVTVLGPDAAGLGVGPDPKWLRDWNLDNLESYWSPWAAAGRSLLADFDQAAEAPAERVVWAALGPGRLHCTITTGEIISKTAAADYTAECFPGYEDLLARAKAWRLGDDSVRFTAGDGWAACELIDAVVADARRVVG